jgi:hypothetical protein
MLVIVFVSFSSLLSSSLLFGSPLFSSFFGVQATERFSHRDAGDRQHLIAANPLPSERFEFGLIGDLPYTPEDEAKFPHLMTAMNQADLAFVIHDGDLKSGGSLCSDQVLSQRRELLQTSVHPLILIPGDNDWTDCHRENNGSYDPIERLAKLREMFFATNQSLGQQTIRLTQQSEQPQYRQFRENVRWSHSNVLLVGLNVVGSNNNFGRTPAMDAEYVERNAANLVWMQQSFQMARDRQMAAIVLIIQANLQFDLPADNPERSGFNDFIAALETETLNFDHRPVILVHGDNHYFRIDKPLVSSRSQRRIENFTRVETFGTPDVHWVRAIVDPADSDLFSFEPEIVNQNLVNHLNQS